MTKTQLLRILFLSLTLSIPFALLELLALHIGEDGMGAAWQAIYASPAFGTLFFKSWAVLFLALLIGLSLLVVWPQPGSRRTRPARAAVATDGGRMQGKVKWFNSRKGYGFILLPDGKELFVHYREIRGQGPGRRTLRDGQRVEFGIGQGRKGPEARDVHPV